MIYFIATFISKIAPLKDLHFLSFSPNSADQALDRFAMKKFFDDNVSALMQPSQKRYFSFSFRNIFSL